MRYIKEIRFIIVLALVSITGCEYTQEINNDASDAYAQAPPEVFMPRAVRSDLIEGARIPTVAIDSKSGKMYAAFFMEEEDNNYVYVSSRNSQDTTWSSPVLVSDKDDNASVHGQAPAQVVVGPEGNVYVVWTNRIPVEGRRFPASNLLFARSLDGGKTFEPQRSINTDAEDMPPAGHTFHDITVGDDGTIYASWLDSRERYRVMAINENTPIKLVNHGAAHSASMHEPGTQVWVAHSIDQGLTFSEGTVVARETCQCCRTSIMVAEDETVYVAWRHIFPGTERDMALSHSVDGGKSFSEPARIYADNWSLEGCPHSGPSLVIDKSGRFHAAWYTGEESKAGLYYSTSDDGVTFADPITLATEVGVSQVLLSGQGEEHPLIVWEDKKEGGIQLAYVNQDGALEPIPLELTDNSLPAIDVSSDTWIVASQEKDGVRLVQGKFN